MRTYIRRQTETVLCVIMILLLTLQPLAVHAAEGRSPIPEDRELYLPTTGNQVSETDTAAIDTSYTGQGYVMCRYTGPSQKAVVQISKIGSGNPYNYYIGSGKEYEAIPLTQGDGFYYIQILSNLRDNLYIPVADVSVDVVLENGFLPFLYASHVIRYDAESSAVAKARTLTKDANDDDGKIAAIYRHVVEHIKYDDEKAKKVAAGYTGNPDDTLRTGKGICIDYAVLAATMLRSQSIPAKVVYGTTPEGKYHAWISVYSTAAGETHDGFEIKAGAWNLLDPTFASSAPEYMKKHFEADRDSYIDKYEY